MVLFCWLPDKDGTGFIFEELGLAKEPEPAGLPKLTQLEFVFSFERFFDFRPLPLLLASYRMVPGHSRPDTSPCPLRLW